MEGVAEFQCRLSGSYRGNVGRCLGSVFQSLKDNRYAGLEAGERIGKRRKRKGLPGTFKLIRAYVFTDSISLTEPRTPKPHELVGTLEGGDMTSRTLIIELPPFQSLRLQWPLGWCRRR